MRPIGPSAPWPRRAGCPTQRFVGSGRPSAYSPTAQQTFHLSGDPLFVEKVRDIIGLYLAPPDRAVVLCVDEKSQIQALDRAQPVLPMLPGMAERRTHTYVRHGTTSLFAALDVATGFVIGKCYKRQRAREFLAFLQEIDARVPEGLAIHIVLDNYATHKTTRRSRRGWRGGPTIRSTSPRPRPPGSTKSSAGLPS